MTDVKPAVSAVIPSARHKSHNIFPHFLKRSLIHNWDQAEIQILDEFVLINAAA